MDKQKKIDALKRAIASPATPEAQKKQMQDALAKLEEPGDGWDVPTYEKFKEAVVKEVARLAKVDLKWAEKITTQLEIKVLKAFEDKKGIGTIAKELLDHFKNKSNKKTGKSFEDWENTILEMIEDKFEATRSDAQGLLEAQEKQHDLKAYFNGGMAAKKAFEKIFPEKAGKKGQKNGKSAKKGKKNPETKVSFKPDFNFKNVVVAPPKRTIKLQGGKEEEYNCDEIIAKEKERRQKASKNSQKQAAKSPSTKNKEAVEKVTERVGENIKERLKKGEVGKEEIKRLISETKDFLNMLEQALKKA